MPRDPKFCRSPPRTPTIRAHPPVSQSHLAHQRRVPEQHRAFGEDDQMIRRSDLFGPVVWYKGHAFSTAPEKRSERDQHLSAIDRNRHGVPEEWWHKKVAQEALKDFHASGADEHLERLRAAWIDTPPEGPCAMHLGTQRTSSQPARGAQVETWAPHLQSHAGQESRQRLAHERLRTLNDLRRRADRGCPQDRYDSEAQLGRLPFESGSPPRSPDRTAPRSESVPIRNHHGKIIDWQPQPPTDCFEVFTPESQQQKVRMRTDGMVQDDWDRWQGRWTKDHRHWELDGWGKSAMHDSVIRRKGTPARKDMCAGSSAPGTPSSARSTAASSSPISPIGSLPHTPTRAGSSARDRLFESSAQGMNRGLFGLPV